MIKKQLIIDLAVVSFLKVLNKTIIIVLLKSVFNLN